MDALQAGSIACAEQMHLQLRHTLVMTSRERSMRFMSRSEMAALAYAWAPDTSLSMRMRSRQVVTTLRTSRQLSLRTVSMPCSHTWGQPYAASLSSSNC